MGFDILVIKLIMKIYSDEKEIDGSHNIGSGCDNGDEKQRQSLSKSFKFKDERRDTICMFHNSALYLFIYFYFTIVLNIHNSTLYEDALPILNLHA